MKLYFPFLIVVVLTFACCDNNISKPNYSSVEITPLLMDSLINIRALELNDNRVVVATATGYVYACNLTNDTRFIKLPYTYSLNDTLGSNNFRSLAITNNKIFTLSIENPAKLFCNDTLVYYEKHPKVFYDAMAFWNDSEGIAIGDPTDDCMSIIITRDGGKHWKKLNCNMLPSVISGEAAFAASDTNIAIVGNNTWVATGGKASRVLYSPNKGKTWQIIDTPIVQGKATTGIYSIDFYDAQNGFAIGGDYTKPNENTANKMRTTNGGKTWALVGDTKSPGYRSCVQYLPNSNAKVLVAVGFKGIDCSNDAGNSWQHLSDEGFYTLRFLNDTIAYAAGKGRVCRLRFK